jgi:prepilin-type N-terminal cleavage/methylation domain-containing protein
MLKALWRKLRQEEQGFTLVELLVVVVILGILAGVGIQQFGNVQERARQSAHEANVKVLTSAAQMYALLTDVQSNETIEKPTEVGGKNVLVPDYLAEWPNSPWDNGTDYKVEIKVGAGKKVEIEVLGGKPDES